MVVICEIAEYWTYISSDFFSFLAILSTTICLKIEAMTMWLFVISNSQIHDITFVYSHLVNIIENARFCLNTSQCSAEFIED